MGWGGSWTCAELDFEGVKDRKEERHQVDNLSVQPLWQRVRVRIVGMGVVGMGVGVV